MAVLEMIQQGHKEAEDAVLTILREGDSPLSARELVEAAYQKRLDLSADALRLATWTLLEKGRIKFTSGRRLKFVY